MGTIAYVNGQYVRHGEAVVHIEDRGFQFADAVYEVIAVQGGHMVDGEGHFDRLERSLGAISIPVPMSRKALQLVIGHVLRQNRISFGAIYLQISRGQAPRDFPFPKDILPTLVITAKRLKPFDYNSVSIGVEVISIEDIRWKRCDIKSVSLLAGAMGKTHALKQGAFEAWQVNREGYITEGTSSNAWIVTKDGVLMTRHLDTEILGGITRQVILKLAHEKNLKYVGRAFTLQDVKEAREAFTSSTTAFIRPVVKIDGFKIGDGKPGSLCLKLLKLYGQHMEQSP